MNRNKEISLIWSIFLIKKEMDQKIKFSKIFNFFKNFDDFDKQIISLKNYLFKDNKQLSFFNNLNINEINKKIDKLWKKTFNEWNKNNIKSISKFDFLKFNLLKDVKNIDVLFYKGDSKLLNLNKENVTSFVGSRKTPINFIKKIDKFILNSKVIVSGLAYGTDLNAHKKAKELNKKIIVLPGKDILKEEFNEEKKEILDYALKNGIILSEILPNSNTWNKLFLLKRNKTMAQISSKTFVVWFEGQSGTLGQVLEAVRNKNQVFMFKEIYEKNKNYLENHNYFKEINLKTLKFI